MDDVIVVGGSYTGMAAALNLCGADGVLAGLAAHDALIFGEMV